MKAEKPAPTMNAPPKEAAGPRQGTDRINQDHGKTVTPDANGKPIDMAALEDKAVPDYYHARSERFLVRNCEGRWLPHSAGSFKRILARRGIAIRAENGESLSCADHEILAIQDRFDVDGYGPLCGRNSGFIDEGGTRFLVTEDMNLIEPMPGKCPTIFAVCKGLLHDGETEEIGDAQLHTFYGLLKSSIKALRAGRHQQQQALAICGPKDCGKSFVQHHIITPCLAGRSADAARYFLRGSDFNSDLFKVEHLALDDAHSSTSTRDRVAFGAKLKTHTVGASVKDLHAKGKDAMHMRPWWRISITLNDGPESMMVLPPLDENLADKLILLHASSFNFPMPIATPEERDAFERQLHSEIPAFLHWLLHIYEIPEAYVDRRRYNISTYHHPELRDALDRLAPEAELLELIDLAFKEDFASHGRVRLTAAKIEERISNADKRRADRLFHFSKSCGTYLGRLAVKHPGRVEKSDTATERGWMLMPPSE
jgi:hypothetical protein